jgi:hypothetical protein
MKLRPAPPAAIWFLKLFCSNAESDSVVGDLIEQYQFRRSRAWYWQQVLAIVILKLYRDVCQVLTTDKRGVFLENAFPWLGVIAVLMAVAASPFRIFLIFGVGIGLVAGLVKFGRDNEQGTPTSSDVAMPTRSERSNYHAPDEAGAWTPSMQHALVSPEPRTDASMKPHRGINSASVAGEGLDGLPGLLIAIAFIFMFLSIFLPRDNQWFLVLFVAVEAGAAALYIRGARRDRRDAARARRALHEINER